MRDVLSVGDRVDKVMSVAKKVKKEYSNGKFILFQFSSREGLLRAVFWEPTPEAENDIHVRDVVRVKGEIQDYQGALQLKVSAISKLSEHEYDPALFLPVSPKPADAIYSGILKVISSVNDENLRALLQAIFEDEGFKESFQKAPAAKGWHHAYVGGLAEHVHDMLQMAVQAAEVYSEADRDLLITGVLLHDLGKLQELSVTNYIDYSDPGRLIGHIALGVEFLDEYLRGMDEFPVELEIELKHMILSHHGSLENGSPVVPMTIEALLLHYLDNMDAQVRGALQVIEKAGGDTGSWTEYVRLLDRYLYRGRGKEPFIDDDRKGKN
jgi:3'-5' exoribonuclease